MKRMVLLLLLMSGTVMTQEAKVAPLMAKDLTGMEAVHESLIGGFGFRLLVRGFGLVTALLSVTGVLICLKKICVRRHRLRAHGSSSLTDDDFYLLVRA